MAEMALDQVDILMVDPDRNAQSILRTILGNSGFRNFQVGRTIEEMRNQVDDTLPDLLISECELPDGDFCDFVYSLRHHELGRNPFVSIIALTQAPSAETVSRISNCGVDHLVVKPFSTAQMVDRIMTLMKSRKLFVVTSDYIGPDRRQNENRGNSVARIAVPNTLRAKVLGRASPEDIQKAIDITLAEVNIQKLERYDDEIGFLVDRILPAVQTGRVDDTAARDLERLIFVAGDTGRRLTGTKYAHVSELCQALLSVSDSVFATLAKPDSRDLQLLRPLSQAIRVGFATNERTVAAAHEISTEALARFREAQEKKTANMPRRRSTDPVRPEAPPTPTGKTAVWVTNPLADTPDAGSDHPLSAESASYPSAAPDPSRENAVTAPSPAVAAGPSFEDVFVDSLCAFVRQRLEPWQVEAQKPGLQPFVLSASFCDLFEEAIRLNVSQAIPRNRRMVVLAQGIRQDDISGAYFEKLLNEINPRDNVPRFLWNNWWDDIRCAATPEGTASEAARPIHEDAYAVWQMLQEGAPIGRYDPPRPADIAFFKSLFDFTATGIRNGILGLKQVLQHEAKGEAQEGASRNYILAQIEKQPPYFGDLLALWAYYARRDFTPGMQKSLLASAGKSPGERRLVLPLYLRWAPDLTRQGGSSSG